MKDIRFRGRARTSLHAACPRAEMTHMIFCGLFAGTCRDAGFAALLPSFAALLAQLRDREVPEGADRTPHGSLFGVGARHHSGGKGWGSHSNGDPSDDPCDFGVEHGVTRA